MTAALRRHYRITLSEFLRSAFVGKPPSRNTIKAAIRRGEWAGETVGGLYFLFVDESGDPIRPSKTGNSDADALLQDWECRRT